MMKHWNSCLTYHFSNSWTKGRVTFLFTIVGLIIQIVILLFFTTKLILFEVKTEIFHKVVIIFLLDHHNNVLFSSILVEVHS